MIPTWEQLVEAGRRDVSSFGAQATGFQWKMGDRGVEVAQYVRQNEGRSLKANALVKAIGAALDRFADEIDLGEVVARFTEADDDDRPDPGHRAMRDYYRTAVAFPTPAMRDYAVVWTAFRYCANKDNRHDLIREYADYCKQERQRGTLRGFIRFRKIVKGEQVKELSQTAESERESETAKNLKLLDEEAQARVLVDFVAAHPEAAKALVENVESAAVVAGAELDKMREAEQEKAVATETNKVLRGHDQDRAALDAADALKIVVRAQAKAIANWRDAMAHLGPLEANSPAQVLIGQMLEQAKLRDLAWHDVMAQAESLASSGRSDIDDFLSSVLVAPD